METQSETGPVSQSALGASRLDRLIGVGRSLLSELDLDSVLNQLLETARDLTAARYAALGILDDRRRELAQFLTRGIDPETHAAIGDLPLGRGVLGLLISEPRPLRLEDVNAHAQSYGLPPGHPPMRTFLGVPIRIRGEAWGNLYLTEKAGGEPFTAEDEQSCIVLADWAAIAIDNARLYRRAETRRVELERAVRGFEATAAIAGAVGTESDVSRVLELIVKRGRALVEARSVVILLPEGDDLVVAAGAGQIALSDSAEPRVLSIGASAVLDPRRATRIADVSELQLAHELGVPDAKTALVVPLTYRGRPVGVLAAFDRLTGNVMFSAEDEQVLQAFAASAATAVGTARSVEADRLQRSLLAAERERGRWARELHDETLQGLGALRLRLAGLKRLGDADALRGAIDELDEHVRQEIANLRGIITDLRPPVLDEVGLKPALETLGERVASTNEVLVQATLDMDDDARLSSELETTIYRLVQEALTNTIKHADAGRIGVDVRVENGGVRVRVTDDGRGFDPGATSEGFGLIGMRERVELAGGTLHIAAGNPGTVVEATLPSRG